MGLSSISPIIPATASLPLSSIGGLLTLTTLLCLFLLLLLLLLLLFLLTLLLLLFWLLASTTSFHASPTTAAVVATTASTAAERWVSLRRCTAGKEENVFHFASGHCDESKHANSYT
jgi:hypothetical protein